MYASKIHALLLFFSARTVAFEDEREPVRKLRHPSEEETALAREHRPRAMTLGEPAPRVGGVGDRGGDVALRRRETRHAARADQLVDGLAGAALLDDGGA